MQDDRWGTIQTLYLEALKLEPGDREPFLEQQCGGDTELAREVRSLLEIELHALFDGLAVDAFDMIVAPQPGDRVERYRLTERIGEGGMGVVYRAERADGSYEQTVALKLVKPGMDSLGVLRRFEAERQILAGLRHPGIARLIDGGLYQNRPFLVMEYVDGESITAYCDRKRLDVAARLRLFEDVCEAVAFAHRNLVVHRDLKPSNILVEEGIDGRPHVKLLDFGIARLVHGKGDDFLHGETRAGDRLLTPAYAAPEQLAGDRITTATDVYGLGVVLYELLTGVRPIAPHSGMAIAGGASERPTVPPSAAEFAPELVKKRPETVRQLERVFDGDLDVIVLKALSSEANRRYASAAALLDDLRRYRSGMPVEARPASMTYRLRKFAHRHRFAMLAAAASVAALAAVATLAFVSVMQERDRARREAVKAAEVVAFLKNTFRVSDPSESRGQTVTARELLDRGVAAIERDLASQPLVRAEMLQVVGEVYGGIGLNDVADTLLQRALVLRRKARGDDHPDVGRSLHALGVNAEQLGRYEAAASLNEAAAAVFRIYGEAQALALARALHSLAHANMRLHRLDDAERQIRESLEIKRRMLGEVHEEVPYGLNILGDVYNYQGRYEEAESVLREVLEIRRELLGDDHLDVGVSYHNLGAALLGLERYAEAEIMYREALVRWLGIYGGEHQETANTMSQMAFAVGRQGRYEESDSLHEVAIGIMRRVGEDHPRLSFNLVRRARILAEAGRFEAAERAMGEAVRIQHRVLGESYPGLPRNLSRLATFVLRQGRFDEAESLLLEGLHLCDANPDEAPACRETMQEAIGAFEEAGRRMSQVILAEGMR